MPLCFDSPPSSPRTPTSTMSQGGAGGPSPSKRPRFGEEYSSPHRPPPKTPCQKVEERLNRPDSPLTRFSPVSGSFPEKIGKGAFAVVNGNPNEVCKQMFVAPADNIAAAKKALGDTTNSPRPTRVSDAVDNLKAILDLMGVDGVVPVQGADVVDSGNDQYAVLRIVMPRGEPFLKVLEQCNEADKKKWWDKYIATIRKVMAQLNGRFYTDIKPANAVVIDGEVLLCDHGMGKKPELSIQYTTYEFTSREQQLARGLWIQYQEVVLGRSLVLDEDKYLIWEEAKSTTDEDLVPFWPR